MNNEQLAEIELTPLERRVMSRYLKASKDSPREVGTEDLLVLFDLVHRGLMVECFSIRADWIVAYLTDAGRTALEVSDD